MLVKLGSTINLELEDAEKGKHRLRSKILDYHNSKFYIDYPISEESDRQKFFLEGTEFQVSFIGKDEAVYSFKTEVTGRVKKNIPMLVLRDPGKENYSRIQRREYVRIDTSIDLALYSEEEKFQPFTTITNDISGGGMSATLPKNHKLHKNDVITAWLSLPYRSGEIQYLSVKAQVIRIRLEREWPRASFKFRNVDEGVREKIIRFTFEKQHEESEKGLH
ncbi:flagellar brake protein [Alkalicoccus daliensis]|uniref:C-di-GMP-binding flagellar brake protein YcgR, contains PilZNR and PilZ domains n=1 Tax=Alkalicoccus daliensis TaxID=745820 RepID=A0A1H0AXU0_9BACI|nr:flagellar brake domain-containing protein [Alkalicoccus daliensis]SDN37883.1 c-di-GMP-binding flagellar brake protein YcgR, contains PilZNR and PilZ domains [Alkalicoccus daliensis]